MHRDWHPSQQQRDIALGRHRNCPWPLPQLPSDTAAAVPAAEPSPPPTAASTVATTTPPEESGGSTASNKPEFTGYVHKLKKAWMKSYTVEPSGDSNGSNKSNNQQHQQHQQQQQQQ